MISYKLDYTIEKILENNSKQNFAKTIQDHKWLLSERLGRDVGLFVAVTDYFLNIQNFSQPRHKHAS